VKINSSWWRNNGTGAGILLLRSARTPAASVDCSDRFANCSLRIRFWTKGEQGRLGVGRDLVAAGALCGVHGGVGLMLECARASGSFRKDGHPDADRPPQAGTLNVKGLVHGLDEAVGDDLCLAWRREMADDHDEFVAPHAAKGVGVAQTGLKPARNLA
jgi:hypothetical protein